ncbi:MAG: GntR family transcriptional regulator [Peptostreptococcaceae bacterium]|nr:GntR family transcriptional regulator [Peptostreptococcaceae bacterium]
MYRDIIQLRIFPGTRLIESKIADELGISRTPVNYALRKLSEINLVNKGTGKVLVVNCMSAEECNRVYEARIALEGYAAFLAVTNISSEQLVKLNNLATQYTNICNSDNLDTNAHAKCDQEFHETIIVATRNKYIMQMYDKLESALLHYRYSLMFVHENKNMKPLLINASKRHQALCNAFNLGFVDVAKNVIEQDIGGMKDAFRLWNEY